MMYRESFACCCFSALLVFSSSAAFAAEPGASGSNMRLQVDPGQTRTTDTIFIKNGSILHGMIVAFEKGFFTIIIPGTNSRASIYVDDIERIEFFRPTPVPTRSDQPTTPGETEKHSVAPAETAPPGSASEQPMPEALSPYEPTPSSEGAGQDQGSDAKLATTPAERPQSTGNTDSGEGLTDSPAASSPTEQASSPTEQASSPTEQASSPTEQASSPTEQASSPSTVSTRPAQDSIDETELPIIHEMVVQVSGQDIWADSGLDIVKGDQLRLSASGQVNLSRSQSTGPEGVNIADPRKMLPGRPTGALIAVIGDDNDDFFFVGAAVEFVAQRSGRLFLMVNEDNLDDNSGAFNVRIQAERTPSSGTE